MRGSTAHHRVGVTGIRQSGMMAEGYSVSGIQFSRHMSCRHDGGS